MQGKAPSNSRTEYLTVWGRSQLKDFLFWSHGGSCGSSVWCVRHLRALAFFLPVCTATKQTISQNLQGDLGHCKSETDPSSADKTLLEEMMKVQKLRETMKNYNPALVDTENLQQAGWNGQVVWHPELLQWLSGGCRRPREGNSECCKGEEQKQQLSPEEHSQLRIDEVQIQVVFTKHGCLRSTPSGPHSTLMNTRPCSMSLWREKNRAL